MQLAGIERTGFMDQYLREISIDAPIADLIGIGQCAACDGAGTESQMVELSGYRAQAGFNIPQTLAGT